MEAFTLVPLSISTKSDFPKGSVYLEIPGIGRMIEIWGEVFFKMRVSFDVLVISKEFISESSHCIETHLDVVKEVLEISNIVSFELYLDEELIEFW